MYYGQFNPPVDKVIHERYYPNKYNGTSIECGAFDGLSENCTKFFEENYNWKTINIEPLPSAWDKLVINRPKSINLNYALSNYTSKTFITQYKHPYYGFLWTNASIKHKPNHLSEIIKMCGKDNYITYDIVCKTYADMIKEVKIDNLDLFVLDVEGHEKEVIEGMKNVTILPKVFVIEHGHESPEYIKNIDLISEKYVLDYISFVNSFYVKRM